MPKSELRATLGLAAIALMLGACGLSAGDGPGGPFARLGPPEAPVNLYYEEQGKGPPVLLLHGFGASTYTWRHITPELARTHRVIAVDFKGFGQSDKPFDERYSVLDQAELIAQLIEDKDLRDLTIVGHSFGGGVALRLALEANTRLGGRIARLVLLDSIAYQQQIPVRSTPRRSRRPPESTPSSRARGRSCRRTSTRCPSGSRPSRCRR